MCYIRQCNVTYLRVTLKSNVAQYKSLTWTWEAIRVTFIVSLSRTCLGACRRLQFQAWKRVNCNVSNCRPISYKLWSILCNPALRSVFGIKLDVCLRLDEITQQRNWPCERAKNESCATNKSQRVWLICVTHTHIHTYIHTYARTLLWHYTDRWTSAYKRQRYSLLRIL